MPATDTIRDVGRPQCPLLSTLQEATEVPYTVRSLFPLVGTLGCVREKPSPLAYFLQMPTHTFPPHSLTPLLTCAQYSCPPHTLPAHTPVLTPPLTLTPSLAFLSSYPSRFLQAVPVISFLPSLFLECCGSWPEYSFLLYPAPQSSSTLLLLSHQETPGSQAGKAKNNNGKKDHRVNTSFVLASIPYAQMLQRESTERLP